MREIQGKADIKYPTDWKYKVIGLENDVLRDAIDEVLGVKEYSLRFSNRSKKGKFISLEISLNVESETERDSIFFNLKSHSVVKMVI